MRARDVMTTNVITVTSRPRVDEIARLLLKRRISAVPVVGEDGAIVGIVSEADMLRRPEIETERHRPWWLMHLARREEIAEEYVKTHGTRAEDVMTRNVITVREDTTLGEIAHLLEVKRIKRVPVVRDGKIVGIVSRANLLHGLAARKQGTAATASADDHTIRQQITDIIERQGWLTHGGLNVIVTDGVVEI
ncbi:MAG: CBS domain-containing protein [Alphaproteobacteria bacterium]